MLSELDCLFSLAKASTALGEPACRPEFVEGDEAWIDFEELRHPALQGVKGDFIPNDVRLGGGVGRIALLTGMYPNLRMIFHSRWCSQDRTWGAYLPWRCVALY